MERMRQQRNVAVGVAVFLAIGLLVRSQEPPVYIHSIQPIVEELPTWQLEQSKSTTWDLSDTSKSQSRNQESWYSVELTEAEKQLLLRLCNRP